MKYKLIPFVLSFADRDMFMRYHWGFAVGHRYTHANVAARANALLTPFTAVPPQPGITETSPSNQREGEQGTGEDEDEDEPEDQVDLVHKAENEMVYQRSDVECSDSEEGEYEDESGED